MRLRPRWLVAIGVLAGTVAAAPIVSRLVAPGPGPLKDALSRVRVGMSQDEAVAILRSADEFIDLIYVIGESKDGKPLLPGLCLRGFNDLPRAGDVEHAKVELLDREGHCFAVLLGQNGVVTGKRFSPSCPSESLTEWLAHLLLRLTSY
jgi:hypothetical protein